MKPPLDGIHYKRRLTFADNDELRDYYVKKYDAGGYETGYSIHGVDISRIYHDARFSACRRLVAPLASDEILDAGCGSGCMSASLAPCCREVTAIDVASNAMSEENAMVTNIRFEEMNLESMTFAADRFDRIVCIEALEHVLNPEIALREIYRVLRPGGVFALTYPTVNQTLVKRARLAPKIPLSEHLNEWRYSELLSRLEEAGFIHEETEAMAFDFGPFQIVKRLSRNIAFKATQLSLAIKGFPRNSLFVAMRLKKPLLPR